MKYTVDYFIQKFEAIPENEIGQLSLHNKCALWHVGITEIGVRTAEASALINLFCGSRADVTSINDSPSDSAKNNILKKLREIKALQV